MKAVSGMRGDVSVIVIYSISPNNKSVASISVQMLVLIAFNLNVRAFLIGRESETQANCKWLGHALIPMVKFNERRESKYFESLRL